MEELDSLKLRYRCPECKNLESHRVSDKKRKCEKCGKTLTEITEKDYHHYKKKKKKEEEDKKEKKDSSKNIDKKEKKKKRKKRKKKIVQKKKKIKNISAN